MTNEIALEYSSYLNNNPHDLSFFKTLYFLFLSFILFRLDQYKNDGDCHLTFIVAKYEEDVNVTKELTYSYFMEMGYLFLEVESDRKYLLDP